MFCSTASPEDATMIRRLHSLLPLGLILLAACSDEDPKNSDSGDATAGEAVPAVDSNVTLSDVDGDGWTVAEGDCDDSNHDVYPGAPELCDGLDDNCDGVVDETHPDTDGNGIADCLETERCDGYDNDGDGLIDEGFDADGDGLSDCLDSEECDGLDNDGDGEIDEGFDYDGDGFLACGPDASDCDDSNAAVNPVASEIDGNGQDDDCDGIVDNERWDAAALIITEIMNNPAAVADPDGEWFELHNPGSDPIELAGLSLRSGGGESHLIQPERTLAIPAGGHVVLGLSDDPAVNGSIPVDYVYSDIRLGNEADVLQLWAGDRLIDEVAWDDGVDFPDVSGASMELDALAIDASLNDTGNFWCASVGVGPGPDAGTPGASGGLCPTVDRDGDGYAPDEGDCDDTDITIGPGMTEVPYDGLDNDCDPLTLDDDLDEDGFDISTDCDDLDDTTFPGSAIDATSSECMYDGDGDGYGSSTPPAGFDAGTDCDDVDLSVNPGEDEVCDGVDNDCDTLVDDDDSDTIDASFSWIDVDVDGYGDATSTPVLSCSGAVTGSGFADNPSDCDDADPAINPESTEVAYDGIDDDCDGADLVDVDRDGFADTSVGGTDCDDDDNMVFPYQWEDNSDGVDNDCDGAIDTADTDSPTSLSLSDDDYDTVSFGTAAIDFCGTTYTSLSISSNGLLTFSSGTSSLSESANSFAGHVGAAAMWDDLRPASGGGCGTIYWFDHGDAVGVYYRDVCQYSSGPQTVTATVIFHEDGLVHMSHEYNDISDGLVGVSCGDGTVDSEWDLSDDTWTDLSLGLGQGTENMVYEQWSSGNDIDGTSRTFCMQSGTDSDSDDWTDECGDQDDTDAQIYPR